VSSEVLWSWSFQAFIISSYAYIRYSFVHAIGAPETATSFELDRVNLECPEVAQETEVQLAGPEEPEEEVECPSHGPTSFVKGKPRSILSLPLNFKSMLKYVISIDALRIGVALEPLLHYTFSCTDILPYLGIESGSSSSLVML